jgi:hypothetical protein
MTGKLQARQAIAALFLLSIAGMISGLALKTDSQSPSTKSQIAKPGNTHTPPTPPKFYEDDEIKVQIPEGWIISSAEGKISLAKNGYTLGLAYHTGHASGGDSGRFIEMLTIPWLQIDDAWTCSLYLGQRPQPASRALMLINLTFNTDDTKVRTNCGIPKDLGYWTDDGNQKTLVGDRRWFAAYFTTASGGWFFLSDGSGCVDKAYTLTSKATTPEELPDPNDPNLKKIIAEAIDIVDSIHYKRCPPSTTF